MKVLDGKAGVFSIRIDNTFYRVFCATRVRFQFDHEEVLITSRESTMRERQTRLCDWGVQLDGLTKINNNDGDLSFNWLLQQGVRGQKVFMRLRYTDAAGTQHDISGNVLVKQGALDGVAGGFSTASMFFPGTGAFNMGAIAAVANNGLFKLYLNTTSGAFEVSHADLGGATEIMQVVREDGLYEETIAAPVNRKFKFTDLTTSGKITFDSSLVFNPGEIVYIEFKKPV